MNEQLYGKRRLADVLDVDQRTAGAILSAIADIEIAPGIWRLTEDGLKKYLTSRKHGNVQTKEKPVGSTSKAPRWTPD